MHLSPIHNLLKRTIMSSEPKNSYLNDFSSFFTEKKGLVVATTDVNRTLFKTLLKNSYMDKEKIFLAHNYKDAIKVMEKELPEIIISEYQLNDEYNGLDLFDFHQKQYENRLNVVFCLVTENFTPELIIKVAEGEIDSLISKPFTPNTLEKKFYSGLKNKINPSEYQLEMEKGKLLYREGKKTDSLEVFKNAQGMNAAPTTALYYQGLIHKDKENFENAVQCFVEGAKYTHNHYGCLHELFNIFMDQKNFPKALQVHELISKHFPVDAKNLPPLIEMSVQLERYDDLVKYYKIILEAEDVNIAIKNKLAYALIQSGKKLLSGYKKTTAMDFFTKAIELSQGDEKILTEVTRGLIKAQEYEQAEKLLSELAVESKSPKLRELKLDILERLNQKPDEILKLGMELLREGHTNLKTYKIVIKRSKQLGRRKDLIEDIIYEAKKKYPTLKL